jgi:hypothetical protein
VKLVEAGVHADAGVVDQSVDAPEFRYRFVDQPAALVAVSDIRGDRDHLGARISACSGRVGKECRVAGGENQLRTFGREHLCNLETDARGRAGNYDNIVSEN